MRNGAFNGMPHREGTTLESFDMHKGQYPCIVPSNTGFPVKGALYENVPDDIVRRLDQIEGYPWLFDKKDVHVETGEEIVKATVYVYNDRLVKQGELNYFEPVYPNEDKVLNYE